MKKTIISIIILCVVFFAFLYMNREYYINEPYDYSIGLAVPNKVAKRMTTLALLETFLSYPEPLLYTSSQFVNDYIDTLKKFDNYGLNELMSREDIVDALLVKYNELEVYTGEYHELDGSYKQKLTEYDAYRFMWIEFLASQLNLEENSELVSAIKSKHILFYDNNGNRREPYYPWYEFALQNQEHQDFLQHFSR